MILVYFTKFETGRSIAEMAEKARRMGLAGLDLAVREGQSVNPDNVESALPEAVRQLEGEGLSVPMVTAEGTLIDPQADPARRLFAACGGAGVGRVKLGYWIFKGEDPLTRAGEIRKALEGFADLATTHGVTALLHTHSGPYYGLNAWGLQHLLDGFPAERVAAYLDPGHLAADGEPLAFAFALHAHRLGAVAIKDPRYVTEGKGAERTIGKQIVPMGQGLVDWPTVAKLVRDFDGPVSFHAEYEDVTPEARDALLLEEVRYFNGLLEA